MLYGGVVGGKNSNSLCAGIVTGAHVPLPSALCRKTLQRYVKLKYCVAVGHFVSISRVFRRFFCIIGGSFPISLS